MLHEKNRKYAFVHLIRSGGVFTNNTFEASGLTVCNSWRRMNRDWTSEEVAEHCGNYKNNVMIHNHAIGWNESLVEFAKSKGFVSFSIIRNPIDQLISSYKRFDHYKHGTFREFVIRQLERENSIGREPVTNTALNYMYWEIPTYYKSIETLIKYDSDLSSKLNFIFGTKHNPVNVNKSIELSVDLDPDVVALIKTSEFYIRYEECLDRCV